MATLMLYAVALSVGCILIHLFVKVVVFFEVRNDLAGTYLRSCFDNPVEDDERRKVL